MTADTTAHNDRPDHPIQDREYWNKVLVHGSQTRRIHPWSLLNPNYRDDLAIFQTPGCQFELFTPRIRLRQVQPGDIKGIERIKMEPLVQKTQLYGSPSARQCRDSFQTRYIRSSIPWASISSPPYREEYIFAIALLDPHSITLNPPSDILPSNHLSSTAGYLGNIALSLSPQHPSPSLSPRKGKVHTHPTFQQMATAGVTGSLFYELHPQVWGKGLMTEAFERVLTFAMEEIGCNKVICNPITSNQASIKLCTKFGMRYTHTDTNNEHRKPQAFHKITREEWWDRHRPGQRVINPFVGKPVCRWCMNHHRDVEESCQYCSWAKYCSLECRRADWVFQGGHQAQCDGR